MVLLAAAVIPLTVLARQNVLANAALLAISLPMGAVGLIVARRQPGNPIGWLLLVIPAGVLLGLDAGPYAWLVYRLGYRLPFGPAAVLLENSLLGGPGHRAAAGVLAVSRRRAALAALALGAVVVPDGRHRPVRRSATPPS